MNYLCARRHTDTRVSRPDERHRAGQCRKTCECNTVMDHQNRPTRGRGLANRPNMFAARHSDASLRNTRRDYVPPQSPPLFSDEDDHFPMWLYRARIMISRGIRLIAARHASWNRERNKKLQVLMRAGINNNLYPALLAHGVLHQSSSNASL